MTAEELLKKLPKDRDHWFVKDIANAYDPPLNPRTVQYALKRAKVGTRVRRGPRGIFVFQIDDLPRLCEEIKAEVGNPINKEKSRELQKHLK